MSGPLTSAPAKPIEKSNAKNNQRIKTIYFLITKSISPGQLFKISSGKEPIGKAAVIILQDHIQGCIRDGLTRNEHSDEYMDELLTVIERFTLKK